MSVWIPATELTDRINELPARDVPIRVIPSGHVEAVSILAGMGRRAFVAESYEVVDLPPRARLWQPSRMIPSLSRPGRALDIGCGSGRDAVFLASEGWRVTAIDVLPDAIEMARSLSHRYLLPTDPAPAFEVGKFQTRLLLDASYDLILVVRSFRRSFLPRLERLLAPGGEVVVEVFEGPPGRNRTRLEDVAAECGGLSVKQASVEDGVLRFVLY